jgi:RNA polymerase sigma factor (TIGR02999 family)
MRSPEQKPEPSDQKAKPGDYPRQMLERYYNDYRRLAHQVLAKDQAGRYLQPTELAHVAAIKLFKVESLELSGRTHFLSLSARIMRQVLIDEVRRYRAQKRQTPPILTQWPSDQSGSGQTGLGFDIEDFHESLARLEAVDPERARIVEQRFFAGLTIEEIAAQSGLSESTVKRQWRVARAWLIEDLAEQRS